MDTAVVGLKIGGSVKVRATVTPSNANDKKVTWSSQDSSIASVTQDGEIKGLKEGRTTIIVSTSNNIKKEIPVTVQKEVVEPTNITVDDQAITIKKGDSKTINATISPNNATDKTYTLTSGNTSIVSVSGHTIKGEKPGATIVTVSASNGKKTDITVTVVEEETKPPVTEIENITVTNIKDNTVNLNEGETFQLNVKYTPTDAVNDIKYSGCKNKKATYTKEGLIKGITEGTCIIKINGGKANEVSITVNIRKLPTGVSNEGYEVIDDTNTNVVSCAKGKEPEEIKVGAKDRFVELKVGENITIKPTVGPDTAKDKTIYWSSTSKTIVDVNQDGKITGKKAGSASVIAKTCNGKSVTINVTVK